jgi:hypothetical protein
MDAEVFDAVMGSDSEDLVGVMTDLVDAGLFQLPYPRVDFRLIRPGGWEIRGLELSRPVSADEVRGLFGNNVLFTRGTLCMAVRERTVLRRSEVSSTSAPSRSYSRWSPRTP